MNMQVSTVDHNSKRQWTKQEVTRTLDQSILRQTTKEEDITNAIASAKKYSFRSLVIHPCNIPELIKAKNELAKCGVLIASVSDFPHGRALTKKRVEEVKDLIDLGVDEVDIVSQYQALLSKKPQAFEDDLRAIVQVMQGRTLKIILEVDLLTKEQIEEATRRICKIAREVKGSKLIVKTKTGYAEVKMSNVDAVKIIKPILEETDQYAESENDIGNSNGKVGIKASGGIKTIEDVLSLLNLGVHIVGTSSGESISDSVS